MDRYEGETRCKELLQEIERLKEEKATAVAAERERCFRWTSGIDDGAMPSGRTVDEAMTGIESGAPAPREG